MTQAMLKYADQGPVLAEYRKCTKFVHFIMGPLGSGKTHCSIFKIINAVCQQRPNRYGERRSRWYVVRNTYPDLINTTIRDWKENVEPLRLGQMTMGHPPEMKMDFDLPDNTRVLAEIIFLALDKDDDVRKLRGAQATAFWFNEVKEIPWSIIDMATGRVDRYPKQGTSTWVGLIGDTNAWDQDHELERIAEGLRDGKYQDYALFVQPGAVIKVDGEWRVNKLRENQIFIGEEYYRRQIEGKKEDWIKVNLANQVGYYIDGRAVHPEYSDSLHGVNHEIQPVPGVVHIGCDFGLTPAAAFAQKVEGQWRVFDEIAMTDGDAAQLARLIKERQVYWNAVVGMPNGQPQIAWVVRGDPAGDQRAQSDSSTPFMIMRQDDVLAYPASTNDPVLRRAALDRPLTRTVRGKPGILFSSRCRTLRKGLAGGFHYKKVNVSAREEKFRDAPDKNFYSHVCEALEYALVDAGEHSVVNPEAPSKKARPPVQREVAWSPFNV